MTQDIQMDENYQGWDYENEKEHFAAFLAEAEYCGERWYIPFKEIKDKVYEEAQRVQKTGITKKPLAASNYNYVQNVSSGCAAINGICRTFAMTLEMMRRKGKAVPFFRAFEGYPYAVYHALIAKDYSYGGCTLTGVMTAVNKYGILPYSSFCNVISDKEMVNLGWNRKTGFKAAYEKYGAIAERYQIVTTVPDTFDDLLALARAGYAIGYGTDKAVKKGSDGIYKLTGGKTAHSMSVGCLCNDKYIGHANSYGDNCGWISIDDHHKQWDSRYYDCFAMIDVERTEFKGEKADLNELMIAADVP